jgi:hypothetical protein
MIAVFNVLSSQVRTIRPLPEVSFAKMASFRQSSRALALLPARLLPHSDMRRTATTHSTTSSDPASQRLLRPLPYQVAAFRRFFTPATGFKATELPVCSRIAVPPKSYAILCG